MSSESENSTEKPDAGQERREGAGNNKRASAAALMEAFSNQYQADREENSRREGHRIFREWLTIIGLFIAAGVAVMQWRELKSTDHSIADQAKIAGEQAKIATNQLKVMQSQLDEMQVDRRPWIDFKVSKLSDLEIRDDGSAVVQLRATMRNTGRVPSLYTEFFAEVLALKIPMYRAPLPRDEHERGKLLGGLIGLGNGLICTSDVRETRTGPFVFPGDTDVFATATAVMSRKILDDARTDANSKGDTEIYPVIVACVRYEEPGLKPRHTVKVLHLKRKSGCDCGFRTDDKRVPIDDFELVPFFRDNHMQDNAD